MAFAHPGVALQDGGVDELEGVLLGERDVEDAEERHEARVHLVPPAASLAHSGDEAQVFEDLAVELLAPVVQASPVQQQLEESDGLLRAVVVHLQVTSRYSQGFPARPERGR